MKIYEYTKGNRTLFHTERDDKYNGIFIREIEVKPTHKDLNRGNDFLNIGDVIYVNKYDTRNRSIGFKAEVLALKTNSKSIKEKLLECSTVQELDSLRFEIALDKTNFIKNQKLFISTKNRITRQT